MSEIEVAIPHSYFITGKRFHWTTCEGPVKYYDSYPTPVFHCPWFYQVPQMSILKLAISEGRVWSDEQKPFDVACGFMPKIIMNIINAFCSKKHKLVEALVTMAPTWQTLLTMESPEETAGSIRSDQLQSCQQMAWISSITFVQRNADRQATSKGLCHTLNSNWPTACSLTHPFCHLYLERSSQNDS